MVSDDRLWRKFADGVTTARDNEPARYVSYHVVALQLDGFDGWALMESDLPADALASLFNQHDRPVAEWRLVTRGGRRFTVSEALVVRPVDPYWRRDGWGGWVFDRTAKAWRAPGEPVLHPPGPSVVTEELTAAFDQPCTGWLRFRLSAAGAVVEIRANFPFNTFPDLIEWLENIARGDARRTAVNEEGWQSEIFTFPVQSPESVRLVVANTVQRTRQWLEELDLDVTLSRRVLVAGIYRPLVTLWESEAFRAEGIEEWRMGDDEYVPMSVRSAALDALIPEVI